MPSGVFLGNFSFPQTAAVIQQAAIIDGGTMMNFSSERNLNEALKFEDPANLPPVLFARVYLCLSSLLSRQLGKRTIFNTQ